ncbi:unnamed protein product, partial [Effrenium voratum]
ERLARRRDLALVVLVLAGLWAAACDRAPREASLHELVHRRYRNTTLERSGGVFGLFGMADSSFNGSVAKVSFVNHSAFAYGSVTLKVTYPDKKSVTKSYEHRYLGLFSTWLPLPYLPQPGRKAGYYGMGACMLGRCLCLPKKPFASLRALLRSDPNGSLKSECWRFEGGKSAALNAMVLPNAAVFLLWQFPKYWSALSGHSTLSIANLARGRLWVLLAAPLSHRSWGQIFHLGVLLANTVDSFDSAKVSFWTFALLYWGGVWCAFLARALWHWIMGDVSAKFLQEAGCSGGLGAQLVFLAQIRPLAKYQFSLYFMPMPIELSAWQSAAANMALDCVAGDLRAKLLRHGAALGWGLLVAYCYQKH